MGLMLVVIGFMFRHVAGSLPSEERLGAVVAAFCGNYLIFNSLLIVFLLAENIFFLEKGNKIMETVFSAPVSHRTVLLSKSGALALVAWGYPVLILCLVAIFTDPGIFTRVSVPHAVLVLAVLPMLLFFCSVITGVFLLLAKDIRVKNMVTTAILFAVMGLSKEVVAISKASGFWPIVLAYCAVAAVFLIVAGFLYGTVYSKAAILNSSY